MSLQRQINLKALMFIAVGGVIGSGWVFGPLITAQLAGPASIISWLIGGLGMMILALSFAETSSLMPVAGGIAKLPMFSHGKLTSVAMGWTAWLGYNTAAPIETIAMLDYLAAFFPSLKENGQAFGLSYLGTAIAILLLGLFTVVNALGVKFFAKTNTWMTWLKIAIPLIIAVSLLKLDFRSENFHQYGGFMPAGWHGVFAAISSGGIVFSFIGFRHAIDMAGESANPQRTIPIALVGSLCICLVIYELLQIAFIGAIDSALLEQGWSTLSLGSKQGPLASLISGLGIAWLTLVLYAGTVTGPMGAALVSVGSSGRLAYAIAEMGLLPRFFTKLSRINVPINAMLLNLAVGVLVVLFLPFEKAVTLNGATIILSFSIGPIALCTFRKQFADRPRHFRLPWATFFGIAGLSIANLIIYWSGWNIVLIMVLVVIAGLILILLNQLFSANKTELHVKNSLWLIPYLAGLSALSYLGNYGGIGVMPENIDVLVIAAFSVVIFYLAFYSRLSDEQAKAVMNDIIQQDSLPVDHVLDDKIL